MSSLRSRSKSLKAALAFSLAEPPVRHRCRRPKCGLKLQVATNIMRNAFCCRGCRDSFYTSRCLVCERPMQRNQESQLTCDRSKCKAALRRDRAHFLGKWGASNGQGIQTAGKAERTLETSIKTGLETATKPGRWRQTAGPPMSAEVLRLATSRR